MKYLKTISTFYQNFLELLTSAHHTLTHKIFTLFTGGYAGYVTVEGVVTTEAPEPGFWQTLITYFSDITPTQFLGFIALVLLVVERVLIIWAWRRRIKRGDYDSPNVGKKK